MKQTIFSILTTLLITLGVNAQYFDKTSNWTEITTNVFDDTYKKITSYKIDGDTLIDDKSYSKVFKDNAFYSALRETNDHKVFAYFSDLERELLIYDFKWFPNDTLYYQPSYDPDSLYIQAFLGNRIDSTQLLDGKYYKCLKNHLGEIRIIHGIGDIRGFFISTFDLPSNGSQFALLCFFKGDQIVYHNPNFDFCDLSGTSITKPVDEVPKMKIYPQPARGKVTFEFPYNHKSTLEVLSIYNQQGVLMGSHTFPRSGKVEVTNLLPAIYFYLTTARGGHSNTGKFVMGR